MPALRAEKESEGKEMMWLNALMLIWLLAVIGFFWACWYEEKLNKEERIKLKKKASRAYDRGYEMGYWHGARN